MSRRLRGDSVRSASGIGIIDVECARLGMEWPLSDPQRQPPPMAPSGSISRYPGSGSAVHRAVDRNSPRGAAVVGSYRFAWNIAPAAWRNSADRFIIGSTNQNCEHRSTYD